MSNEKKKAVFAKVTIRRRGFDPRTGKPTSKAFAQYYDKAGWENFLRHPGDYEIVEANNLPDGFISPEVFAKREEAKAKKASK